MISSLVTSKVGWASVATGIVWVLTAILPVVPSVWGNLLTAVLGIISFYHIGQTVTKATALGAKGI